MKQLGLENLSCFGMDPVAFVELAGLLGCGHVSLNLRGAANRMETYPPFSLREDTALCAAVASAAAASGVSVSLLEGFAILPDQESKGWQAELDVALSLGARAICAVSMERDRDRSYAAFSRLTEQAAERGMIVTTEVGAGILRNLERSLAAVAAVAHPGFRLLIDTMHFFRSGSSVADLAAIDPSLIGHIQLCDVPMPAEIASYMDEALFERRCPGGGDLPLAQFLAHIPSQVPIGLEVPIRSEALAGLGPHERMARCVSAAHALMGGEISS